MLIITVKLILKKNYTFIGLHYLELEIEVENNHFFIYLGILALTGRTTTKR